MNSTLSGAVVDDIAGNKEKLGGGIKDSEKVRIQQVLERFRVTDLKQILRDNILAQ